MITKASEQRLKGIEELLEDEEIIDAILGLGEGRSSLGNNRKRIGVLVLTSKRLIFYYKKTITGHGSEDYPLDKINSINFVTGLLAGSVKIHSSGNSLEVDMIPKSEDVEAFVKTVKSYIPGYKKESSSVSNDNLDIADQISKFAELRDKGILTEEEFAIQKRKLLGL